MSERKIDYILAAAVGHEWTDFTEAQLEGRQNFI